MNNWTIPLYHQGNHAFHYTEIGIHEPAAAWRDGMVSGNGTNGYITSGSPYYDSFIFQHMWFNFPSADPRHIPTELTAQLQEARQNVWQHNDGWTIKHANGERRNRTFYYSYHPGHQLRLSIVNSGAVSDYVRWTNYETAETGVRYRNEQGVWLRTSFTSRQDNVSITRLQHSDQGSPLNMTLYIDNIAHMSGAQGGMSDVHALQYKKIVDAETRYIAQIAHYPSYPGSELRDGGYAGVTQVVVVNGTKRAIILPDSGETMNVGQPANPAIEISNADAIYLITASARTHTLGTIAHFAKCSHYELIDHLFKQTDQVVQHYKTADGSFDYEAALATHSAWQRAEFNAVQLSLAEDKPDKQMDNLTLIELQKAALSRIEPAFLEQVYNQGRYAMICCSGASAPRLYGMWTGEWNPGWRGIYTLDANVNLQVAAMNTGQLTAAQRGYICFFLRNAPDFQRNAEMAYGMHDAIQVSVNSDGDRAMHVEYDNDYPFQYWNAGASWCLLPMFEYWQCFGDMELPIVDEMNIDRLQSLLSPDNNGLSDEAFHTLKEHGSLKLLQHILVPLLTKQANFWQQICTPEYFTNKNGQVCYEPGKTSLQPGEHYVILPAYSPENHPIGYNSTITANATMDIAAARDGLQMIIQAETALKRPGYEQAIAKWQQLLVQLPVYTYDTDGALREWAMPNYLENNNHRHLSHLYAAWPAYDTQTDPELATAATIALQNRDRFNTADATAGHGWMHKALVHARLKNGAGVQQALLPMMTGDGYYTSLMTDHDTNRRNHCYCTDTAFGVVAAIHEALLYSNTGEIEVLPALIPDWKSGSINGLMARSQIRVNELVWNIDSGFIQVRLYALLAENTLKLSAGIPWLTASIDGVDVPVQNSGMRKYISVQLQAEREVNVIFKCS
ncbi:glycosyl hydrolase family 95 catalytic domain-containing protein [Paenibacillus campi]|uniref:glycosyl hydrolase family 95 catalytic domain-containing protein n=1 Tax=Paenibacillus campi TaxID=3106031 RepID=UPI002AFFC8D4|nr:glycoside hydrolase N-terminal domain-containing protein [Paenibacillus sp. SGZ-1014]